MPIHAESAPTSFDLFVFIAGLAVSLGLWSLAPDRTLRVLGLFVAVAMLCYAFLWVLPGPRAWPFATRLISAIFIVVGLGGANWFRETRSAAALENAQKDLETAKAVAATAKTAQVPQTLTATLRVTSKLEGQLIPGPEKLKRWGPLRVEASEFAEKLLTYLVAREKRATKTNIWNARVIEAEAARDYMTEFNPRAQQIAYELHGYGRRGDDFDAPYNRLDELVKQGPRNFGDIRDVAGSILKILSEDGYATLQK
jgi:hypothetical protein